MSSVQFTQEGLSTGRVGFWFELTFSGWRGIPSGRKMCGSVRAMIEMRASRDLSTVGREELGQMKGILWVGRK